MSTKRRDFLSILGGTGMLAAGGGSMELPEIGGGGDPFIKSNDFDYSWMKRVKGKGRAVHDMPAMAADGGWGRVTSWREIAVDVYGDKNVTAIAVIRHAGIQLATTDAYWEQFKPGSGRGGRGGAVPDTTAAAPPPVTRNPIGSARPGATDAQKRDYIRGFIDSGGIVLACNLAWYSVVSRVGTANNLKGDEARKKSMEYLIPGVLLQPSGVFAMIAAQQLGCGLLPPL